MKLVKLTQVLIWPLK